VSLRIGLAGYGVVAAQVHLPVLKELPGVVVQAIGEQNEELLKTGLSVAPSANGYSDYCQMLDEESLDAVLVCLPTPLHAQAAREVLSRGIALYLEKPLGSTLEEGRQVLDCWRACSPRPLAMVGFNFRRAPVFEELKRHLLRGKLGRIHHLHSVNSRHSMVVPEWKEKRSTGGGVLLDLATHHLDLWEHLLGQRISSITTHTVSVTSEQDTATVQAVTNAGVTCSGFFAFDSAEEDRITVYGERGRLSVERMSELRVTFKPASSRFVRLKGLVERGKDLLALPRLVERYKSPWSCSSYRRSMEAFLDGVARKKSVKPDLADGLRALELVTKVEKETFETQSSLM
jgi:predicted dehydrogenase